MLLGFWILILFSIFFQFFYLTISDLHVWQIRDKKLINKGTGREYSYDTSKQGYNLDGEYLIEERYIADYLNTAKDQWKFCHEDDETFKIKCTSSGSFLRAKSDNDGNRIIKGNFSFLLIILVSRYVISCFHTKRHLKYSQASQVLFVYFLLLVVRNIKGRVL